MKKQYLLAALLIVSSNFSLAFGAPKGLVKAKSISGKIIDALPNQVIVKYKKGGAAQAKSRIFRAMKTKVQEDLGPLEAEILTVPPGETIDSFIAKLQLDPDVKFAEPNGIMRASAFPVDASPDDPQYGSQYYLNSSHLDMEDAWRISQGSPTVTIAVLDTGALLSQAEFNGQFITSTGTTIGIDWNMNGNFTDTVAGCNVNCLGNDQVTGTPPMDNNINQCDDDCNDSGANIYHGTRVSSLIGAVTNNGSGMAGVAHNAKLMIVKVLNNKGTGSFTAIAAGIRWAVDNGADVINMSLGGSSSSGILNDEVAYAIENDVVVVAASGNSALRGGTVEYPAALPGVIAVGAIDSTYSKADFSCGGQQLDLVAPGVAILTLSSNTIPTFTDLNGTSFSSPLVAGVAGLVRSLNPDLTYFQVTQYINYFSDDLGPLGFDTSFGFGRLNANRVLTAVASGADLPSNAASPGKTYPFPNPYNPTSGSSVEISVPSSFGTNGLEITIKNLAGETIKTLSGTRFWDGKNKDGNPVASGLYFYYLKTSAGNLTGKLTVIK